MENQDDPKVDTDPAPSTIQGSTVGVDKAKPDSAYFIGQLEPECSQIKYLEEIRQFQQKLAESPQTEDVVLLQETIANFLNKNCNRAGNPSTSSNIQTQMPTTRDIYERELRQEVRVHPGSLTSEMLFEFQKIQIMFADLFAEKPSPASVDVFGNPKIMKTILDYLPVRDVRNFRTLNTDWSKNGALSLQNRHSPIQLYSASIRRVTKALLSSPVVPYTNFELQMGTCLGSPMSLHDCLDFFTAFGPDHVKSLKIYEKSVDIEALGVPVQKYRDMLQLILTHMDNLESLTLWQLPHEVTTDLDFIMNECMIEENMALKTTTLTLCSKHAKPKIFTEPTFSQTFEFNLKVVEWHPNPRIRMEKFHELARQISRAASDNSTFYYGMFKLMPNLKVVNLIQDPNKKGLFPRSNEHSWLQQTGALAYAINNSQVQELNTDHSFPICFTIRLKKPFEVLRFHVYITNQYFKSAMQKFLRRQTDSLKTLQVTSSAENRETIQLPRFPNLRNLEFRHERWNQHSANCTCAFYPFSPDSLPMLESLSIALFCLSNLFPAQDPAFTGVKELTIKEDYGTGDAGTTEYPNIWKSIPILFPNLKKLKVEKIYLTSAALRIIFRNFTELEELDLFISSKFLDADVDHVLSGFDSEDGSASVETSQRCDSLLSLKHLKKLRIEYRIILREWSRSTSNWTYLPKRQPMGESTLCMTLLKMSRLQLTLVGNVQIELSEMAKLEMHHENFTVMQ